MKKIAVLGGGISGLAAAFRIQSQGDLPIIFEKEDRVGGWIKTTKKGEFLFEQGPRTFQRSRCGALLELIHDLGLEDKLLFSSPDAKRRFIYTKGKLQQAPGSLIRPFLWQMATEWLRNKGDGHDETILSFFSRRFSPEFAWALVDPIVQGIYAGDIATLSMEACFGSFFEMEQKEGSLTRGFLKKKKQVGGLFSLQGGMETLTTTLSQKLGDHIHLSSSVTSIEKIAHGCRVNGMDVDKIVSTLPMHHLAPLIQPYDAQTAHYFRSIPQASITCVGIAFEGDVLPQKGYGYLVPTVENESILGVIFDSAIFPNGNNTSMTVMIRGTGKQDDDYIAIAMRAMKEHLKLHAFPTATLIRRCPHAIPQFPVNYTRELATCLTRLKHHLPGLTVAGNFTHGPSVNQCLLSANMSLS